MATTDQEIVVLEKNTMEYWNSGLNSAEIYVEERRITIMYTFADKWSFHTVSGSIKQ